MLCFVMMCAVLNGTFISLASFKSKWWMKIESKKKICTFNGQGIADRCNRLIAYSTGAVIKWNVLILRSQHTTFVITY